MAKNKQGIIKYLIKNGCSGDLDGLEIMPALANDDLRIKNCEFIGKNKIYGPIELTNSTIKNSTLLGHNYISHSIVIDCLIGRYAIIENFSIVKNTTISCLTIVNDVYPILINNSQIDDDIILGGCDFNKTKSRGNSIFAFAHIGGGEFIRSTIIGTPPTKESSNNLVEIGHFGYYGDSFVLGLAAKSKDGSPFKLDCDQFFAAIESALKNVFFGEKIDEKIKIEQGRCNFGAGTTVSNYNPVKDSKAGAIFLLSSVGANVSIAPYLTVLPHSLIATGSVDITRDTNVISENSLVIGARPESKILSGYYDDLQTQIMNERPKEEIAFLVRLLKMQSVLANVAQHALDRTDSVEKIIWQKILNHFIKISEKLSQKTFPNYFDSLKLSIEAMNKKIEKDNSLKEKYSKRLISQNKSLSCSKKIIDIVNQIMNDIGKKSNDIKEYELDNLISSNQKPEKIIFTKKQKEQLEYSLIDINNI